MVDIAVSNSVLQGQDWGRWGTQEQWGGDRRLEWQVTQEETDVWRGFSDSVSQLANWQLWAGNLLVTLHLLVDELTSPFLLWWNMPDINFTIWTICSCTARKPQVPSYCCITITTIHPQDTFTFLGWDSEPVKHEFTISPPPVPAPTMLLFWPWVWLL